MRPKHSNQAVVQARGPNHRRIQEPLTAESHRLLVALQVENPPLAHPVNAVAKLMAEILQDDLPVKLA